MLKLENIIGMEEAKAKLNETIDALKNGQRPEPVLLVVGSWMGKTYLIRKTVKELAADPEGAAALIIPCYGLRGVSLGAAYEALNAILEEAEKYDPLLLFVDEADLAFPRKPNYDDLVILKRFIRFCAQKKNLAAWFTTPNEDRLYWGFEAVRRIRISALSRDERKKLFQLYRAGKPLADDVNLDELADLTRSRGQLTFSFCVGRKSEQETVFFTATGIAQICDEAARCAIIAFINDKGGEAEAEAAADELFIDQRHLKAAIVEMTIKR